MHSSTHSMVTRHCTTSPPASTLLPTSGDILSESFTLDRNQHTTVSPTEGLWAQCKDSQHADSDTHTHTDGQRADIMSWSHHSTRSVKCIYHRPTLSSTVIHVQQQRYVGKISSGVPSWGNSDRAGQFQHFNTGNLTRCLADLICWNIDSLAGFAAVNSRSGWNVDTVGFNCV